MSASDSRIRAVSASPELFADMSDTALILARKHRLMAEDGKLYCWNCNRLGALLPSLRCARCLEEAREAIAHEKARERTEHPETKRWRCIFEQLAGRPNLDRATAEKWVRKAEALETATEDRQRELWRIFENRFGAAASEAPKWSGRGFRDD